MEKIPQVDLIPQLLELLPFDPLEILVLDLTLQLGVAYYLLVLRLIDNLKSVHFALLEQLAWQQQNAFREFQDSPQPSVDELTGRLPMHELEQHIAFQLLVFLLLGLLV